MNLYGNEEHLETKSILEPPSPAKVPIPSMVGVWIFSGTTQYYLE